MRIEIQDPIFTYKGKPGIVVSKDETREVFKTDTESTRNLEHHRHGYIKGLTPEKREEFNMLMDDIKSNTDPETRVSMIKAKIDEMESSSYKSDRSLLSYLKSELAHTMNTHSLKPRYYDIPFNKTSGL